MNAASNVHVAIRLRKLTCNELGLWEMHKLKRKLQKRLALYDQTYNLEGLKYREYFVLAQKWVLTPWVDVRNLLVVTMRRAGVSNTNVNYMCERDRELKKL